MAKRVYQPKPLPLEDQIRVQEAWVVQAEEALDQARRDAALVRQSPERRGMIGLPFSVDEADRIVAARERQLAQTEAKLVALQTEAAP
jgi:hypothetical protein